MNANSASTVAARISAAAQPAGPTGPSTVIRLIDRPELLAGARRLGLSGFIGLDFIIDDATGEAVVIEINPRATPLGASAIGPGTPVAGAARSLGAIPGDAAGEQGDLIAYFPAAWRVDPADPRLALCAREIPSSDPPLLAEMLRTPWVERSALAIVFARASAVLTGRPRTLDLPLSAVAAVHDFQPPAPARRSPAVVIGRSANA